MSDFIYFNNVKTEKGITSRYRQLAKKYHPDKASNDGEREEFGRIMQAINAEHQDILVLLRYNAFERTEQKPVNDVNKEYKRQNVFQHFASMLQFTPEQKSNFAKQGKQLLNDVFDAFIENKVK
jgi:DnaJ-class molecular chaperone